LGDVGGDAAQRRVVVLGARKLEQVARVAQVRADGGEAADRALERFLFPAELLRAPGVAPDPGIGQEGFDFREALLLAFVVKDTSAAPPTAYSGR